MKKLMYYLTVLAAVAAAILPVQVAFADTLRNVPGLIISEVQTGGVTAAGTKDGKQEFIELYNPSGQPYNIDGIQLQYLSASHSGAGEPTRVLATLSGSVSPNGFITVSYPGYLPNADFFFTLPTAVSDSGLLARSGGHVRLYNAAGTVSDLVGWGSAVDITPWWKAPEVPAGMSIQRVLPDDVRFTTGLTFLAPSADVTPGEKPQQPVIETPPEPIMRCAGIELTEIVPNAEGADAGKEFIEIHNATMQPVNLHGCTIQLADNPSYMLPNENLSPGEYRAFYDSQTGITLPNATAQVVKLITDEGIQEVTYANGMADDAAWALINGIWQITLKPTPGAGNEYIATPAAAIQNNQSAAAVCVAGKELNVATHRCRNIVTTPAVTTCKAGQARNPETNRCRSLAATAVATLTPCKTNQERSAETNRCRAVQSATVSKACPAGQVRNSDTNRCRKQPDGATGHLAAVKDIKSANMVSNYRWWLVGSAVVAALSYGLYEWRHDLNGLKHKILRRRSVKPSSTTKLL